MPELTASREERQPLLRRVAAGMLSASGLFPPLNAAVARSRGGVVLAWHSIGAAEFVSQVEALRPNRPVHLDEIVTRIESGKSTAGLFAVTFDDGLAPVARAIVPELIRRGWPATFYLPTGYVGANSGIPFQYWRLLVDVLPRRPIQVPGAHVDLSRGRPFDQFCAKMNWLLHTCAADAYVPLIEALYEYALHELGVDAARLRPEPVLSWDEVSQLSRHEEVRFESHGVSHQAVSALDIDEIEREMLESRRAIQECTGRSCNHFCYPYGDPDSIGDVAPSIAARLYRSAVTMQRGRAQGRPLASMPRVPLFARDSGAIASLKVLTA